MTTYRIYDMTTREEFECPEDEKILKAAEERGISLPYACRAGSCSSCAATLVSGSVNQSDGNFLCGSQLREYVLTCIAYPTSNCVIRTSAESSITGSESHDMFEDMYNEFQSAHSSMSNTADFLGSELAHGKFAAFDALHHYAFGDGSDRFININDVGFDISVTEIPGLMDIINSGRTGSFDIDIEFSRHTRKDFILIEAYLGHIIMTTQGTLNVSAGGNWHYTGKINTNGDFYDANASTHRDGLGEWSTSILRGMNGKDFRIHIPGDLYINENGQYGTSLTRNECEF